MNRSGFLTSFLIYSTALRIRARRPSLNISWEKERERNYVACARVHMCVCIAAPRVSRFAFDDPLDRKNRQGRTEYRVRAYSQGESTPSGSSLSFST